MNNIYRRLWSTARQCWVVASELTCARGKCSQQMGRRSVAAVLLAVPTMVVAGNGTADEELRWWNLHALFALHADMSPAAADVGVQAGQSSGIAVPRYRSSYPTWTETYGDDSMALGPSSMAGGHRSMAFGIETYAKERGVALGFRARAEETHSTAIGYGAQGWGVGSIALGNDSYAGLRNSMALGSGALAQNANSIALGADSNTYADNQVSVGSGSMRRKIVYVADGAVNASSSEVVTGRQLHATNQNVSTAITTANAAKAKADSMGNLVVSGTAVTSVNRAVAAGTGALATGASANANGSGAIAMGNAARASGNHSTALGYAAKATQHQATALGREADASATYATAVGNLAKAKAESALALGDRALAQHSGSVALGNGSQTSAANQVSVGSGSLKRKIVNLADGALSTSSTEAVTGKQLNATDLEVASVRTTARSAQTTANAAKTAADSALSKANVLGGLVGQVSATGNVRLGGENTGTVLDVRNKSNANRKVTGVADATLSTSSTEAVSGKQLNATNVEVASVRTTATSAQTMANAAKTTADSALGKADVLGGLVSQVSATGNVRLGGENTGTVLDVRNKSNASRKLTGVADATLSTSSTEAVTGRQLFGVDQKVTANQSLLVSHASELTGHDVRIAGNRRDLDDLRTEFDNFDPDLEGVVRYAADGSIDMDGGKVRGVAAGDISSAGSADAVNGGQLFATNQRVDAMEAKSALIEFGGEPGQEAAEAGNYGVAIGNGAQASMASEGGTAIGSYSSALAMNSVALGRGAIVQASATAGFALGTGADIEESFGVGLGAYAKVRAGAEGSVALGAYSEALEKDVVSIGNLTTRRRLVNVGRGKAETDATTVAQLGESLASLGGGAGIDVNGVVVAPTYRMQGATQGTVEDALNILDGAVITAGTRVDQVENQLRSVFQSSPSVNADGINHVVLAGAGGAILTNLADGRVEHGSRDAVTGSQLFEAKREIARNRSELNDLQNDRNYLKFSDMAIAMAAAADVDFGGNRLTGISNGRISDGSSDAMTGAQLFRTNERVSDLELTNKVIAISSKNDGNSPAKAGDRSVAIGEYASASVDSEGGTAVGNYAQARARNSVAIGQSSWVSGFNEGGLAIGSSARADARGSMAIGERAWVFSGAENSVAIGAGSEAMRSNEVSIGTYSNRRRLTSVANGIASYDAATAGQLRDALSLLGGGSTLDRQGNIVSPSYKIQGGQQNTVNDALTALDTAVITSGTRIDRVENQLRSVFQDSPGTRSDGLNQLNLAGANGMVLGNVANGLIAPGSRDAVNGGQLHAMEQRLDGRIDGLEQRVGAQPEGRALAAANAPAPPAATEGEGPASASGDPA
ncbi:MAG: ESPR-type extended signal peptide-containing protein, partial [Stenotrophomonas indicatrix]